MHAERLLGLLAETGVAVTVAIALVALLRRPLRRGFGAGVAYASWALVPLMPLAVLWPARRAAVLPVDMEAAASVALAPAATFAAGAPVATAWLLAVWLAGVLACALLQAARQLRFVRAAMPAGAGRRRVLRAAAPGVGPALVGVLRPRILLPAEFVRQYSAQERRLVLRHERTHLRRGDHWVNLLATALRCIAWFNPAVHWADARMRGDQELACDAAVVARAPAARRSYAEALLKAGLGAPPLPLGCRWQDGPTLKERILMLKQPTPTPARRRAGLLATGLLLALGTLAAWAAQPAAPAVDPAARYYRTTLDLDLDGERSRISVVEAEGREFGIAGGQGDARWTADFVLVAHAPGQLRLSGRIARGGVPLSAPELVFAEDGDARMTLGGAEGDPLLDLTVRAEPVAPPGPAR